MNNIDKILKNYMSVVQKAEETFDIMADEIRNLTQEVKDWEKAAEQCGAYSPIELAMFLKKLEEEEE